MAMDPSNRFDEVAAQQGEAAAAKAVIRMSKSVVSIAAAAIVVLVGGALGLLLYGQGRVNSCRDVAEAEFEARLGEVIVDFRDFGEVDEETFDAFTRSQAIMEDLETVCQSGYWPWDLPSDPAFEAGYATYPHTRN